MALAKLHRALLQVHGLAHVPTTVIQKEGVHAPRGEVPAPEAVPLRVDLRVCERRPHTLDVCEHELAAGEVPSEVAERLRELRTRPDKGRVICVLLVVAGDEWLDGHEADRRAVGTLHELRLNELQRGVGQPARPRVGDVLRIRLSPHVSLENRMRLQLDVPEHVHLRHELRAVGFVEKREGVAHSPFREGRGRQTHGPLHGLDLHLCPKVADRVR
mmetsp:Transcript_16730/g.47469  ORF Transcript_16730/g.47469 Transcript_16730/m.47469 type:complete len:216 (+) Transcript_16730:257-904(+)